MNVSVHKGKINGIATPIPFHAHDFLYLIYTHSTQEGHHPRETRANA